MQASRYCITRQVDDGLLVLSTLTGKCVYLSLGAWEQALSSTDMSDDTVKALWDAGVVVPEETDERAYADSLFHMRRMDTRHPLITMVVTDHCNLSCEYCIQPKSRKKEAMNDAVIRKSIAWLRTICERVWGAKQVSILFFGGEPLTAVDVIERASDAARQGLGVPVSLGVFTNGTLLDEKCRDRLKRAGVKRVHVSIDGTREVHDSRRRMSNQGTFDLVLGNVVPASHQFETTLVVNLDQQNRDSVPELLDYLNRLPLQKGTAVAFGTITRTADGRPYRCLPSDEQKTEYLLRAYASAVTAGIPIRLDLAPGACIFERESAVLIGPRGDLYDCIQGYGTDRFRVGSVFQDMRQYLTKRASRLGSVPKTREGCLACTAYPSCRGGCAYEKMSSGATPCRSRTLQEAYASVLEAVLEAKEGAR